jgi:hypothetical protein
MDIRYPIGQFTWGGSNTAEQRSTLINDIAAAPHNLRRAVADLTDAQLDTAYRDGGWTVRQLVHHLTDAHINGYTRLRLALTEDEPTIKTFDEVKWAEFPDAKHGPVGPSLDLLDGLHHRWTMLLRSLSDEDVKRKLRHSDYGVVSIDEYIARWAWHAKHHVAHIRSLRERMNW